MLKAQFLYSQGFALLLSCPGIFIKKVKDLNIIGSMICHVEGSKAFARYREIDDEIKKDALKGIGQLQKSVKYIIISL